jgi:hypothetical protein
MISSQENHLMISLMNVLAEEDWSIMIIGLK